MKMSKVAISIGLGMSLLALTSCSTTRGKGAPVTNAADENDNGAVTSGYGMGAGFNGANGASLKAPANQSYYYDFNSNAVHQEYYPSIQAQANYLVAHPNAQVRLAGNCDNRGSREYNIALGWRRANSVKAVLMQDGVSPKQITTFSWGSEKPVAFGNNESAWSKNRRTDLTYKAY